MQLCHYIFLFHQYIWQYNHTGDELMKKAHMLPLVFAVLNV